MTLQDEWNKLIPIDTQRLYQHYDTTPKLGDKPAVVLVDLYTSAYEDGNEWSYSSWAHKAVEPIQKLIQMARTYNWPVVWFTRGWPHLATNSLKRHPQRTKAELMRLYQIYKAFHPLESDIQICKIGSSGFWQTDLRLQLELQHIDSLVYAGQSTSGCVRAAVTDGFNWGYRQLLVEECCFEANQISRAINLWDMHHKYAPVVSINDVTQLWLKRHKNEG